MLKLDINLVFTVINLLIIYFILSKFLFKPVKNILAKRQEEIDKQYAEAEEAKTQAGALRQQYEACVKGIDEEKRRQSARRAKKPTRNMEESWRKPNRRLRKLCPTPGERHRASRNAVSGRHRKRLPGLSWKPRRAWLPRDRDRLRTGNFITNF